MQTTCVLHVTVNGTSQVLGAVVGEAAAVKGAVQQYKKAIGPLGNRAAFSDFLRQNVGKFSVANCTPIDIDQI